MNDFFLEIDQYINNNNLQKDNIKGDTNEGIERFDYMNHYNDKYIDIYDSDFYNNFNVNDYIYFNKENNEMR